MTSTEQTEIVNTLQLVEGDLVLNHGMRVRLAAMIQRYERPGDAGVRERPCEIVSFRGVVENFDELPADIAHYVRATADPDRGEPVPMWTIQGNDLAHWTRVICG